MMTSLRAIKFGRSITRNLFCAMGIGFLSLICIFSPSLIYGKNFEATLIDSQLPETDLRPRPPIGLTDEEKTWLTEHKKIRLGVDPVWPPFEFFDATRVYAGIASDYVRLLNDRLNIQMAPVRDLSWPEAYNKARAGEIDVLPCVAKTPERSTFMLFTEPYLNFPMVILTREDAPFINGVQDFGKGRVAVIQGYATQELLQRDYPKKTWVSGLHS